MTTQFPSIPGYIIHSQLGEGGFAIVYLAVQINLDRHVALKVMNPQLSQDAEFCERFLREGKDAANLSDHPNIVTTYDIGQVQSLYYIAMQYLPGPTLKDLLESKKPYQHPLHIVIRIADALAYLHDKGYVHRDIKPANILFNEANEAVLADFGIAKASNRDTQLTAIGTITGTPKYMSPEQGQGLADIDGRSDLYSLGVVFYEMLTKNAPFTAENSMALIWKHVNSPIPELPPNQSMYQPVINQLMAKDQDERYQNGYLLIDDIEKRFFAKKTADQKGRDDSNDVPQKIRIADRITKFLVAIGVATIGITATILFVLSSKTNTDNCPALSDEATVRLERLLETADIHEQVGRITQPPGANAIEAYSLALEVDPCNETALTALKKFNE